MELKKRILSLDIGTKRIGAAISDALWMGATPLKVIERKNDAKALLEIEQLLKEYNTDTILIGVPYNMDGTLGFQAKNCLDFIEPLSKKYVILKQDERLTSAQAEENLRQRGKKYTRNKGLVDVTAACIILSDYLESNR